MRYQVALRFPHETVADLDSMVTLEEKLTAALEPAHEVDGHDWGSGEMAIFIRSDHPIAAFETARPLIPADLFRSLKATYRQQDDAEIVLWPGAPLEVGDA